MFPMQVVAHGPRIVERSKSGAGTYGVRGREEAGTEPRPPVARGREGVEGGGSLAQSGIPLVTTSVPAVENSGFVGWRARRCCCFRLPARAVRLGV